MIHNQGLVPFTDTEIVGRTQWLMTEIVKVKPCTILIGFWDVNEPTHPYRQPNRCRGMGSRGCLLLTTPVLEKDSLQGLTSGWMIGGPIVVRRARTRKGKSHDEMFAEIRVRTGTIRTSLHASQSLNTYDIASSDSDGIKGFPIVMNLDDPNDHGHHVDVIRNWNFSDTYICTWHALFEYIGMYV